MLVWLICLHYLRNSYHQLCISLKQAKNGLKSKNASHQKFHLRILSAWNFSYCAGHQDEFSIKYHYKTPFVHTDDVARAHIFLFEYPEAKGRYICSAVEVTIDKLAECLSARYPEYPIPTAE